MRPSLRVPLIAGVLFACSGASALVYQVAWQRILALHSGVGIYSVAVITAAFMAGLGLGSHLGGVLSARVAPARALRLFVWLELGVGAFALASIPFFYDLLYLRFGWLYAVLWRAAVLHLVALIVPTTLMGMSLPFLVRALVRDGATAPRNIAYLYGVNVLGASAGAFVTPWVLIRQLGIDGAVYAGALGNLAAAVGALVLGRMLALGDDPEPAAGSLPPEPVGERHPLGLWIALYALSGFCALSLEVLWFRITDVGVKGTAFTFGVVLAVYLLGLGSGSLLGVPLVARVRRPLRLFLLLQCGVLLYAAATLTLLALLPATLPGYSWFFEYWKLRQGFSLGRRWELVPILRLYLVWPIALFGLPTLMMGLSFPMLQRAVHTEAADVSRRVGLLQAANIAGCLAGSLVVGLLGLDLVGTTGVVRALLGLGLVFVAVGVRHYGLREFALPGLALAAAIFLLPGQAAFWLRLHAMPKGVGMVDEDATGVSAITPATTAGTWSMWVNGRSHSWLPYKGIHTKLGALPALVHPAPLDVAVIGLGSGDTAAAVSCRAETQRLTVFELCAPEPRLLRRFVAAQGAPYVLQLIDDPRLRLRIEDGRNALQREPTLYDVIEADPLLPEVAYSGNLYSEDFYRMVSRRLKPGGIACTWAPTPRVYATMCRVFPTVLAFENGQVLMGSNAALRIDVPRWTARLLEQPVRARLGPSNAGDVLRSLAGVRVAGIGDVPPSEPNRDLHPRDEMAVR